MTENNRKWVLKTRPQGMVERANFEWREEPKPRGTGERTRRAAAPVRRREPGKVAAP